MAQVMAQTVTPVNRSKQTMADEGAPNLDNGMSKDELFAFWNRTDKQPRTVAAELFGSRRFTAQLNKTVQDLGHYASNKGAAMYARESGDIQTAQMYETICERIYSRLPNFARW